MIKGCVTRRPTPDPARAARLATALILALGLVLLLASIVANILFIPMPELVR